MQLREVVASVLALLSLSCATTIERVDAGGAADASSVDVREPARDVAENVDVGADVGADAGPPTALRNLLLLHWPFGLVEWAPRRTTSPTGFRMGAAMDRLRHEELALINDLRASPPAELLDTHADVPPSLLTGVATRIAPGDLAAVRGGHASLDVVVARHFGGAPLVTRTTVEPHFTHWPAVSWIAAGEVSPLVRSQSDATSVAPCVSRAVPVLHRGDPTSFEEMTAIASEQIRIAAEGFRGGCLRAATIELGDMTLALAGNDVFRLMHEISEMPTVTLADMVEALAVWLSAMLDELAEAGVLDDTLVALTTEQGGELPAAHLYSQLPVFLWSRAPGFRPGWIEGGGRPIRDWLVTVARAFGADGTFASVDQLPAVAIEELFE